MISQPPVYHKKILYFAMQKDLAIQAWTPAGKGMPL
jgi:hypothetical protein